VGLDPKSEAALNAVESSAQLQAYFFSKAEGLHWLRPLIQRGFFDAARNPTPVADEKRGTVSIFNWPALDYLERASREAADKADQESASLILDILHRVTKPAGGQAVDNYRTWWKFAKVLSHLPLSSIGLTDLQLLQTWLGTRYNTSLIATEISRLLARFLASHDPADHRKALEIVKIVTHLSPRDDSTSARDDGKLQAVVDAYHLDVLLSKNADALGKVCGAEAVDIIVERLGSCIAAEDDDRYTYVTRGAVEDNKQQNHDRDTTRGVLINAMRDVLLSLADASPPAAQRSIEALLKSEYLTLKRIALYVIGARYSAVGDALWGHISPALFRLELRHELYELIRENFSAFTPGQQATLRTIIDGLTLEAREPEKQAEFNASWRLDWLHAAKGQGDEELDQLYGKYLAVVGSEPTNPSFPAYIEGGWVGQKSPVTVEQLAKLEIGPLMSCLANFQPTGEWGAPSEEGLGETLKEVVKRDPVRFANTLDAFVPLAVPYGYYVLRAFEELWNSKVTIPWQPILAFCQQLAFSTAFWSLSPKSDVPLRPNRSWLTSCMSDLIKAGTRSDEHAFDPSLLPLAQKVLVEILRLQPSDAQGKDDALNEAINTAKGAAVEALFNMALRRARIARKAAKDHQAVWDDLQPIFESELEKCKDANFEFSALAGNYLANLYFLSNDWTVSNINRIFSTEYERNWSCAMQGFAYVSAFYEPVYKLLTANGHLKRVISREHEGRHVRKKILQLIAIAYVQGIESLPPQQGLFADVLLQWKQEDLKEVIWFFWTLREQRTDEQLTRRIMEFWRWCYEKVSGNEEENAEILSKLTFFAAFVSQIDVEAEQWLLQAAPWAEADYNATFLIEELDGLADRAPTSVAKVYKAMLTHSTPTFDSKHIRSTVTKLYAAGLNSDADEICNTYAERGALELVRDIYEAHRRDGRA
jgi:hypothetical protein